MNWIYNGKEIKDLSDFPPNSFGFVYLITHKPTNKKYIGKKVLYFSKKVKNSYVSDISIERAAREYCDAFSEVFEK